MKFTLIGNTTVFDFVGFVFVAGIKCVKGQATIRRRNRKGTGFRNVNVETVARIEDTELVADVFLAAS